MSKLELQLINLTRELKKFRRDSILEDTNIFKFKNGVLGIKGVPLYQYNNRNVTINFNNKTILWSGVKAGELLAGQYNNWDEYIEYALAEIKIMLTHELDFKLKQEQERRYKTTRECRVKHYINVILQNAVESTNRI